MRAALTAVRPAKSRGTLPLRLPNGGTSISRVRDFGASKARKRVPSRSLVTDTVADPALTRGNYWTSSNPARCLNIWSDINKLAGGGGSLERTGLRFSLFNRENTGNFANFHPKKRVASRETTGNQRLIVGCLAIHNRENETKSREANS